MLESALGCIACSPAIASEAGGDENERNPAPAPCGCRAEVMQPRPNGGGPGERPDGDDDESRAADDGEDRGDPVHRHAGGGDRVERADAGRRLARRAIAAGDEHADRGDELPAAIKARSARGSRGRKPPAGRARRGRK